jgi:hypothetical protein
MPTFTTFSDLLPDPVNKINNAGAVDATGSAGPGFAKIKFTSDNTTQVSRTISGRGVTASPSYHSWSFDISYNPMTRDEFDPIGTFLDGRRGRLNPFYVILPQHARPKDNAFYTWTAPVISGGLNNSITVASATAAGSPTLMLNGFSATSGSPSPGDFFTITDNSDVNHKKAYKVLRVEDNSTYQLGTTIPTLNTQRRVWTQPPICRAISNNPTPAIINFVNPKFRVIQKGDTLEYDLDTDNLYQFSLSLEEILP